MANIIPGLVHLYVGDGKGKTTAAMGLAVRARGAGRNVLVAQFLKGQATSELGPLSQLGIEVARTDSIKKFIFQMDDEEKQGARDVCNALLDRAAKAMADGSHTLVVLDEVVDAVNMQMIDADRLVAAVKGRAEAVEVVMTGRNPDERIVAVADYITAMTAQRHPYEKGVQSRKGVEF